uniref:UPF0042 nucleotide-binding protein Lcho_3490 n=1 Tax=Zeugodacus cucurbitae TaxID=28588 RepID=A0A0A1XTC8_ZEUCU
MEYLPIFSGSLPKCANNNQPTANSTVQNREMFWRNKNKLQRALSVVEMEYYRNASSAIFLPRNLSAADMFKQEPTTKILPAFMFRNSSLTKKKPQRRRKRRFFV